MKIKLIDRHKILSTSANVSLALPVLCIYFLIKDRVVVYVGKTSSCINRIKAHKQKHKIAFDSFSFVEATKANVDKMEVLYIKMLEPIHNKLYTYKSGEQRRRYLYRRHLKTALSYRKIMKVYHF
jgi:hypothetical protein